MGKTKVLILTLTLLILPFAFYGINFSLYFSSQFEKEQSQDPPFKIKTVVIDAGHGGHDPGCLGSDSREKHLALAISNELARQMRVAHPDIKVIQTRDKDVFVPLYERASIANRNHADLFISIHCNFMPGKGATKGSETYVMGLHTAEHNLNVAKRENASIYLEEDFEKNYDYDTNSPEGHIILSMFQSAFLDQSILMAKLVEKEIAADNRKSRGVKQAGFVVLKETTMPSILVEVGFLSNKTEETYLKSKNGQKETASSILDAFSQYRFEVENEANQTKAYHSSPTKTPVKKQVPVSTPKASYAQNNSSTTPKATNTVSISKPKEVEVNPKGGTIRFRVQLAASPLILNTQASKWKNLSYMVEVITENKLYKYQLTQFNSFEEAVKAQRDVRLRGFGDAFVVAYQNGQRIPLNQAKRVLGLK